MGTSVDAFRYRLERTHKQRDDALTHVVSCVGVSCSLVRWGVVCERARERDELAMGVMRADGEMVISPAKDATFVFEEGDRIIVLADSL